MKIFLDKKVIENQNISDKAISVYAVLKGIAFNQNYENTFISYNMIGYYMFNGKVEKNAYRDIKTGFHELINLGIINLVEAYSTSEFIIDLKPLEIAKDNYFIVVTDSEIHTIMSATGKTDKYKLLRYFITMVGTFNHSKDLQVRDGDRDKFIGKIGGLTLETLASYCNIKRLQAIRYNTILEDMQLIYIKRSNDFVVDGNELSTIPNAYGRYEDRHLIEEFNGNKVQYYGYKSNTEKQVFKFKNANNKRAMAQKYNAFVKGKQYTDEEIKEIKQYCIEHNKAIDNAYNDAITNGNSGEDLLEKKKDMSVFKIELSKDVKELIELSIYTAEEIQEIIE